MFFISLLFAGCAEYIDEGPQFATADGSPSQAGSGSSDGTGDGDQDAGGQGSGGSGAPYILEFDASTGTDDRGTYMDCYLEFGDPDNDIPGGSLLLTVSGAFTEAYEGEESFMALIGLGTQATELDPRDGYVSFNLRHDAVVATETYEVEAAISDQAGNTSETFSTVTVQD